MTISIDQSSMRPNWHAVPWLNHLETEPCILPWAIQPCLGSPWCLAFCRLGQRTNSKPKECCNWRNCKRSDNKDHHTWPNNVPMCFHFEGPRKLSNQSYFDQFYIQKAFHLLSLYFYHLEISKDPIDLHIEQQIYWIIYRHRQPEFWSEEHVAYLQLEHWWMIQSMLW